METNTGSFPAVGPDPENGKGERFPEIPETERSSDPSPPQHVREALPPEMVENDPDSPELILVEEWVYADATPLYMMRHRRPSRPGDSVTKGTFLDRARLTLAVIITVIALGTPLAMILMRYPGESIAMAFGYVSAPLGVMLTYYFGKKLLNTRKKRRK